jgi:translation initiation factor IF-2
MSKLRIYEIAKEKNLSTRELFWILGKLGIEVKSHMSSITLNELERVEDFIAKQQKQKSSSSQSQAEQSPGVTTKSFSTKDSTQGKKEKKSAHTESGGKTQTERSKSNKTHSLHNGDKKQKMANTPRLSKAVVEHSNQDDEELDFGPKKQIIKKRTSDEKKGFEARTKKKKKHSKKNANQQPSKIEVQSIKKITLGESITVQDFAKKIGKTAAEVIKKLMALGVLATLNQEIDFDTAALVADEYNIEVEFKSDKPIVEIEEIQDPEESLKERPPVVTVMGHVDHGKTSLLDAIRHAKVTATEAGGITQHIGAYQTEVNGKKITFLDTPGHAAFTAMRARGAQATDIAILVVAADDGVKPQTVEAINHAKAANVPIIVAVNKIDKPEANIDRVKQQLTEYGLVPEEWGGDTLYVPVSALKKEGIDQLLEMILLVAEVAELKANPDRPAAGVVIEAKLDKGRGPVATVLVQKGTLKIGDNMIAGSIAGKVRAMIDDKGARVKEASPSVPVEVLGFDNTPEAGETFQVVEDDKLAREIASHRQQIKREEEQQKLSKVNLDDLFKSIQEGQLKELNLIIKADVQGSVEALRHSLEQLNTDEVKVNIIHSGVGAITETDVMLASTSNAIIIGFNVRPVTEAKRAADNEKVDIRLYRIIYEAIDSIKAAMSGLLEPDIKETILGKAEVRSVFKVPKAGNVAGSYVIEGKITNKAKARIIRDNIVIHEGQIESLKRFKDDVKEVSQGYECGIGLEKYNDIKEGDIIEAFIFEEVKREL